MPERTVKAVFAQYTDEDGNPAVASNGDVVDFTSEEEERLEGQGALLTDNDDPNLVLSARVEAEARLKPEDLELRSRYGPVPEVEDLAELEEDRPAPEDQPPPPTEAGPHPTEASEPSGTEPTQEGGNAVAPAAGKKRSAPKDG